MKCSIPFVVALSLVAAACDVGSSATTVKTGPGTSYPCGVNGVVCFDGNPPRATGMCCSQGDVCGGGFPNVGCPSGECCYEGLDSVKRDDAGVGHLQEVIHQDQRPSSVFAPK